VLRKHENRDGPLQTKISDLSGTSEPITVRSHELSRSEKEPKLICLPAAVPQSMAWRARTDGAMQMNGPPSSTALMMKIEA
jgi:hypothetical protein